MMARGRRQLGLFGAAGGADGSGRSGPVQISLSTLVGPPAGVMVSGVDPAKETLYVASIIGDGVTSAVDLLRKPLFLVLPWVTGLGWEYTCGLFGGTVSGELGPRWTTNRGYVLCEAQWAGDDAKEKWSGLSALCHTAGGLMAARVASGMGIEYQHHWTRDEHGNRVGPVSGLRGLPFVYGARGLGFIEPSPWRSIALSPRPITPRAVVRKVESDCACAWFGRKIGPDHAAAFGILLAALGLNYTDLGVGF